MTKRSHASDRSESPRVRILAGSAIAIGPGKADLLQSIDETGSISGAARRMRMSYRRAWLLVRTMNDCFEPPLVEAVKGGTAGGGARLTTTGREVLRRYRELVQIAAKHFAPYLRVRGAARARAMARGPRPLRQRT
jgi:molybdate transport system regulatory protein